MHKEIASAVAGAAAGWISAKGDKSQAVRLADVFLVGPLLLLASFAKTMTPELRMVVAFIAGATISYNARNFTTQARANQGSQ